MTYPTQTRSADGHCRFAGADVGPNCPQHGVLEPMVWRMQSDMQSDMQKYTMVPLARICFIGETLVAPIISRFLSSQDCLGVKKLRISPAASLTAALGRIRCTPRMLATPADAGSVAAGATGRASRGDTAAGAAGARARAGFLLGETGKRAGGCFLLGVSFSSTFAISVEISLGCRRGRRWCSGGGIHHHHHATIVWWYDFLHAKNCKLQI